MKCISQSSILKRGISAVRNAVGSPISNPIVENIHISCKDGKIQFLATNLNLTILCEGEATIEEEGEILLPSSMVVEVFPDLPETDVSIETMEETVFINCGNFNAKMKGQPGELFPPFNEIEEGEQFEIESTLLKEIIKKTTFSTSQEKSRYELNGVKFDIKEKSIICVSTDGRRLSVYEAKDEKFPDKEISALIPQKTLQEVERIFSDEGNVNVKLSERKVQFKCGDVTLLSNLLMENFPKYDRIIPPDGDIKACMNREELASAIKRASHLTSVETNMIVLKLEKGKAEILGEREESGSEGKDHINAEYEGETLDIRFNHKFLLEFLRVIEEEKVELELRDAKKPGVFRGLGNRNYKYILMPMRPPENEETKEKD